MMMPIIATTPHNAFQFFAMGVSDDLSRWFMFDFPSLVGCPGRRGFVFLCCFPIAEVRQPGYHPLRHFQQGFGMTTINDFDHGHPRLSLAEVGS
jgi:hypothetical protein